MFRKLNLVQSVKGKLLSKKFKNLWAPKNKVRFERLRK